MTVAEARAVLRDEDDNDGGAKDNGGGAQAVFEGRLEEQRQEIEELKTQLVDERTLVTKLKTENEELAAQAAQVKARMK